ncbi:MAG: SOS response-associated peptidase [Bosea sp.]|jgi:putative SOS response-associated peptidase YedK|nr:SOS response-associated peptidase [Bosea sp. (in: a-proteobacteria)]
MCGRYALILPPEAVRAFFRHAEQPNFPPRYNIAPTQPVPVLRSGHGQRSFTLMRWGFRPSWVKDPKDFPLVINVRSETAREKPSFRAAFMRRRCLMPADGFYEWCKVGPENRAYLFRRPDRGLFAFAAIWETWIEPDGGEIDTVALLNTHANGLMSAIHHRCPVILEPDRHDAWLDPETTPDAAHRLLQPPDDDSLEMLRVGPAVNKVANDGPALQEPWAPAAMVAARIAPAAEPSPRPARRRAGGADGEGGQGSLF